MRRDRKDRLDTGHIHIRPPKRLPLREGDVGATGGKLDACTREGFGAGAGTKRTTMAAPTAAATRRAVYRASQRGMLELDLILGGYARERAGKMDAKEFAALEQVLKEENPVLLQAVTGQAPPPPSLQSNPVMHEILKRSLGRLEDKCVPGTRASPGRPWTNPWSDLVTK